MSDRNQVCASLPATKKFVSLYVPRILGLSRHKQPRTDTYVPHSSHVLSSDPYASQEDVEIGTPLPPYDFPGNKDPAGLHIIEEFPKCNGSVSSLAIDERGTMTPKSKISEMDDARKVESKDELVATRSLGLERQDTLD